MRIAFGIEYNGSLYHGWQAQGNGKSIQEHLEHALSKVADHAVTVVCAGRTDKGVHATGQVIHFDTTAERNFHGWILGTNHNLPKDIRIQWAQTVTEDFHARFSAQSREYAYIIHNTPYPSAILSHQATWIPYKLDVAAIKKACPYFLGKKDFSSLRASSCQAKHPIRTIQQMDFHQQGELLILTVKADGFLHHMVRNIMGILIEIGSLKRPPEWAGEVIAAQTRAAAGVTALPTGLYLSKVEYPAEFKIPTGKYPYLFHTV